MGQPVTHDDLPADRLARRREHLMSELQRVTPVRGHMRRRIAVVAGAAIAAVAGGGVVVAQASGPDGKPLTAIQIPGAALSCDHSWACLSQAAQKAEHPVLGPVAGDPLPNSSAYYYDPTNGSFQLSLVYHPDAAPTATVTLLASRGSRWSITTPGAATPLSVHATAGHLLAQDGSAAITWADDGWTYRIASTNTPDSVGPTGKALSDLLTAEADSLASHLQP